MNGLRLLADENIDPQVIAYLRDAGFDVIDVFDAGLRGRTDQHLLDLAYQQQRVVLTHDSDFGTLAIHQNRPLIGIIYLRRATSTPRSPSPPLTRSATRTPTSNPRSSSSPNARAPASPCASADR